MRGATHPSPVLDDPSRRARRTRWVLCLLGAVAVVGVLGFSVFRKIAQIDVPEDFANDEMQFKYGSIGSETGTGIPYWIFATLPEVCPDGLGELGWAALGVIQPPEDGMTRPIGFSMRRVGPLDMVAPNCALCHTAAVRVENPVTGETERRYYATAPAHQLDLMHYFEFVFSCIQDSRFTPESVLGAIERRINLSPLERLAYRIAVRRAKRDIPAQAAKFASIVDGRPAWGRGRVDTFNPYKALLFDLDMSNDHSIGTADFMSIWNQAHRRGIWLHWDGNNDSVDERNWSAALGAGASVDSIDLARIRRVRNWILAQPAPAYPFEVDYRLAAEGKQVFGAYCAQCHESGGARFGNVTPLEEIGTDPERLVSFDREMAGLMNTIGAGKPWRFNRFRVSGGYANQPLDGSWLRAPYLHNGSVPTLRDLLEPQERRPVVFYRGNEHYDAKKVGFRTDDAAMDGQRLSRFDTTERGNGNMGHDYGTDLEAQHKDALVEYLKIHGDPAISPAAPRVAAAELTGEGSR